MRKPGKDCNNSRKYMRDVARIFYEDLRVTDVKCTYSIIACDQMCTKSRFLFCQAWSRILLYETHDTGVKLAFMNFQLLLEYATQLTFSTGSCNLEACVYLMKANWNLCLRNS